MARLLSLPLLALAAFSFGCAKEAHSLAQSEAVEVKDGAEVRDARVLTVADAEPVSQETYSGVIGTWNLKAKPFPITNKRVEAIADGIKIIDPDVLVLTEIGAHSRIFGILKALNADASEGEGYFFRMPGLNDKPSPQHELGVAFLCRKGVKISEVGFVPGSDLGDHTEYRKAVTAMVKVGEFDFLMIGTHLKSGATKSGIETRGVQCVRIAEFVQAQLAAEEKDVILTGDFNMIPPISGQDRDVENFKRLGSAWPLNFLDESLGAEGTHIGYSSKNKTYAIHNHLDGLAISKDHSTEYETDSVKIVPLHDLMGLNLGEYHRGVSDHLPLVARFDYSKDDD